MPQAGYEGAPINGLFLLVSTHSAKLVGQLNRPESQRREPTAIVEAGHPYNTMPPSFLCLSFLVQKQSILAFIFTLKEVYDIA